MITWRPHRENICLFLTKKDPAAAFLVSFTTVCVGIYSLDQSASCNMAAMTGKTEITPSTSHENDMKS